MIKRVNEQFPDILPDYDNPKSEHDAISFFVLDCIPSGCMSMVVTGDGEIHGMVSFRNTSFTHITDFRRRPTVFENRYPTFNRSQYPGVKGPAYFGLSKNGMRGFSVSERALPWLIVCGLCDLSTDYYDIFGERAHGQFHDDHAGKTVFALALMLERGPGRRFPKRGYHGPQEMADLSKDHNNTIFDRGRYADIEVLYFGDYDEIMEMINGLPRGGYAGIRITDSDISEMRMDSIL